MKYVEVPVIARPCYCVPAVLEMVLDHYGIRMNQEAIASQFKILSCTEVHDTENLGAQIGTNGINEFFGHNNIPLREVYYPIGHFWDEYYMADMIEEKLDEGDSIICGYNYTWLYGKGEDVFRHVSIIVGYSKEREKVMLLDPGPKAAGYKEVDLYQLYTAIKAGHDGLWCITSDSSTTCNMK